jgi:hypothetical protein
MIPDRMNRHPATGAEADTRRRILFHYPTIAETLVLRRIASAPAGTTFRRYFSGHLIAIGLTEEPQP